MYCCTGFINYHSSGSSGHKVVFEPEQSDTYSYVAPHVACYEGKGTRQQASVVAPSMEIILQIYPWEMTSTRFI